MALRNVPLYNINNFAPSAKDGSFYANDFVSHLHNRFILQSHRHTFYLTVLFTKGSGIHEIDFHKYPIVRGSVFFILPGQVHNWKLSTDINGYIFFHTKEFFDLTLDNVKVNQFPFYKSIQNNPQLLLSENDLQKIEPFYKEIVAEFHKDELFKFQKILSIIYWLYIELSRLYVPQSVGHAKENRYRSRFIEIEQLIEENFKTIKFPKDYAGLMHMSEQHLNRVCKACANLTITHMISNRVILEAKRMLIHSEFSIAEIAFELGYLDKSYFVRVFKKMTGRTPLEFAQERNK